MVSPLGAAEAPDSILFLLAGDCSLYVDLLFQVASTSALLAFGAGYFFVVGAGLYITGCLLASFVSTH